MAGAGAARPLLSSMVILDRNSMKRLLFFTSKIVCNHSKADKRLQQTNTSCVA